MDLISKELIEERIKTRVFGHRVIYRDSIDSTNSLARKLAFEEGEHGLLVVADEQTGGKGRYGRSWDSERGCGIWMSLLLLPDFEPTSASMLTLIAAMAVTRTVRESTGLNAGIKWPNDIVVNGKKVCGILTEMGAEYEHIHHVILGIGINVNTAEFPEDIRGKATSFYLEQGRRTERCQIICDSMKYLEAYYEVFIQEKTMAPFVEEYNQYLVNRDTMVKITGSQEMLGLAKGINEKGELLVETEGMTVPVLSGEVSVRGIYGYV